MVGLVELVGLEKTQVVDEVDEVEVERDLSIYFLIIKKCLQL
jgi:hypothetical protein